MDDARVKAIHAVDEVIYVDEPGSKGYRGFCACGWESTLSGKIEFIGAEFDEHFEEESETL